MIKLDDKWVTDGDRSPVSISFHDFSLRGDRCGREASNFQGTLTSDLTNLGAALIISLDGDQDGVLSLDEAHQIINHQRIINAIDIS